MSGSRTKFVEENGKLYIVQVLAGGKVGNKLEVKKRVMKEMERAALARAKAEGRTVSKGLWPDFLDFNWNPFDPCFWAQLNAGYWPLVGELWVAKLTGLITSERRCKQVVKDSALAAQILGQNSLAVAIGKIAGHCACEQVF